MIYLNIHQPSFLRDIHEGCLSLEGAENKQNNLATELKTFDKGIKTIEKFGARVKVLNNFKSRLFTTRNLDKTSTREPTFESAFQPTPEPTPETTKVTKAKTKRKIYALNLCEILLNKIKNEEKYINEQIFREYFNYQSSSFPLKDLYKDIQNKNDIIEGHANE